MASWFDAYRKIGQAVLRNAVSDANRSGAEQEDARAFLKGGPKLAFWCQVAGLDVNAVRERARQRWST